MTSISNPFDNIIAGTSIYINGREVFVPCKGVIYSGDYRVFVPSNAAEAKYAVFVEEWGDSDCPKRTCPLDDETKEALEGYFLEDAKNLNIKLVTYPAYEIKKSLKRYFLEQKKKLQSAKKTSKLKL